MQSWMLVAQLVMQSGPLECVPSAASGFYLGTCFLGILTSSTL